ncbi:MAG: outer membrane protein assembly factor BamB [SAR86 cluster bacterium]|uniref:Outer membrane protein assembly factor BamB n=1 Tax=SAR86 cluster bacterium TaxID=2030880 RepID=A0A520N664_9GAMM|nr:MAG: outer membrane protein assembly factor BamB [SAR86 cluster bacterium]
MNKKSLHFFAILQIVFILSSCSSLQGLKFWETDEVDPDEPKELSSYENQKDISIIWNLSFDGENEIGNFEPGFSSQNLFFADSEGTLSSISLKSGEKEWSTELNFLASGTAAGFGILVVADVDGNVIALDQKDGSQLWSTNVKGEILSKSVIDTQIVVVKSGSGELIGLNRVTGEIEWSYRSKLPPLTVRGSSSPVLSDDKIFVSFDNGRLGVFDINSGFPLWDGAISYASGTSELDNLIDGDSSPVIEGGLVYTTNYQGNLNIFDIAQKRSVWTSETSSFYSPVIMRGLLIVADANSTIKSFSLSSLEESWLNEDYLNRGLSNPVSYKGSLVVGDFEGYIHIIDPLNGKTIGRKKLSRKPIKSIFTRSNSLYVIDEAFNLFSVNI